MIASSLYLWRNTGYNDGGFAVMKTAPAMSEASFTFSNLRVSKDRLFSEIRVPFSGDWSNLMDCEYLRVDYTTDDGTTVRRYGWIDGVDMLADTDAGVAAIRWHVDPWTTWYSSLSYYDGLVLRRPSSSGIPPQSYPYRYRTVGSSADICAPSDGVWWVYIFCQFGDVTTMYHYAAIPVNTNSTANSYTLADSREVAGRAPSLMDFADGAWDEALGLLPEDIAYVGLSPCAPCDYTLSDGTITLQSSDWYLIYDGQSPQSPAWYGRTGTALQCGSFSKSVSMSTTDVQEWCVCDLDGSPVGSVPWGVSISSVDYRNVFSESGVYTVVTANGGSQLSRAAGLVWIIPAVALGLGDNSWSDYVYSGNRQADIDQRRLDSQNSLIGTLTGAGTSAVFGGVMGKAGAVAGGASTLLGGAINYAYQTAYANDAAQSIEDQNHAKQADAMIMTGSGYDSIRAVGGIKAVRLDWDSYSQTQRSNDISEFGVHVQEATSNCNPLISAGGPLQIANVTITGNAPNSAKQYIKQRLAAGVRIE